MINKWARSILARASRLAGLFFATKVWETVRSIALVERGLGVAVVPRFEAWPISDRVRCVRIGNPAVFIEIAAIWRRENMSPLVRRFIDCAVQLGRDGSQAFARAGGVRMAGNRWNKGQSAVADPTDDFVGGGSEHR
jgi:DNA-binding transcriptional LysR family regulator